MTVEVISMTGVEAERSFRPNKAWDKNDVLAMKSAMHNSATVWSLTYNGEGVGLVGLAPPTLLSDQAYIWFFHNADLIERHKFVLIRYSQRFIESLLKEYQVLVGHCIIDDPVGTEKTMKWLRYLGAKFDRPDGKKIPFWIRRGDG